MVLEVVVAHHPPYAEVFESVAADLVDHGVVLVVEVVVVSVDLVDHGVVFVVQVVVVSVVDLDS